MRLLRWTWALSLVLFVSCNMFASGAKDSSLPESSAKVITLTTKEFKEKVFNFDNYKEGGKIWSYAGMQPAIVDFYADWCGPCRRLSPILAELAKEYEGKIVVYKVDVNAQKEVAAFFDVNSIPMLLFIPMNGDPQIAQGLLPKETLKKAIDSFLLGGKEK